MSGRLVLIVGAAALALAGCHGRSVQPGPLQHDTQAIELDKAEIVRVETSMGAVELNVAGGSPRLLDADFDYDNSAIKPVVRYEASSFRGHLTIEQPSVHESGGSHYEWELRLNNDVPLDVVTHLGAKNAEMNLGAMNLRGDPKRDYNVEIHGGVGSITLRAE